MKLGLLSASLASLLVVRTASAQQAPPPQTVQVAKGDCNQQIVGNHNRVTLLCSIEGAPKWPFFLAGGAAVVAGAVVAIHAKGEQSDQLALDPYARDPQVQQSLKTQDILASGLLAGGGTLLFIGAALWATPALAKAFAGPQVAMTPWVLPGVAGAAVGGRF